MGGPIVRSAPSKNYSKNWSSVFGGGKSTTKASKKEAPQKSKPAKKKK